MLITISIGYKNYTFMFPSLSNMRSVSRQIGLTFYNGNVAEKEDVFYDIEASEAKLRVIK